MYFRRSLLKAAIIFIMSFLIGLGVGQQLALAESKSVWVDPVGTVGTASTTGYPTSGGSVGRSSSSTTLYWLRAHTKVWHTGPILQTQQNAFSNNTTLVQTNALTSSGHGDYAVTYHELQYVPPKPVSTAFTSDSGARSCGAAWNSFVYSC